MQEKSLTKLVNLPKCFQEKIVIDKALSEIAKEKIIPFALGKSMVLRQQTARLRCIQLLKKDKTNNTA